MRTHTSAGDLPLPDLVEQLFRAEMLDEAVACQDHIQAVAELDEQKRLKSAAIADDRLEDAIALRDVISALEARVQTEEQVAQWQERRRECLATSQSPAAPQTLAAMLANIVATGATQAASAFSVRFCTQPRHTVASRPAERCRRLSSLDPSSERLRRPTSPPALWHRLCSRQR